MAAGALITVLTDPAPPPAGGEAGWVMLESQRGFMGGPLYAAALLAPWRALGWRTAYDAGAAAGLALMALDAPFAAILFTGDGRMADKLAAMGRARGVAIVASGSALS